MNAAADDIIIKHFVKFTSDCSTTSVFLIVDARNIAAKIAMNIAVTITYEIVIMNETRPFVAATPRLINGETSAPSTIALSVYSIRSIVCTRHLMFLNPMNIKMNKLRR